MENVHRFFTDLNKACLKDPYPLPRIDRRRSREDIFRHREWVYCYRVMPFGLKNAGATYQRLVNNMFEELIGKTMEVYVDDIVVKSVRETDHLTHLAECFVVVQKYNMKLNTAKCTFGVKGEKFLVYLVTERKIEVNPDKARAITQMKTPRTVKEVQQLTGRIASLGHFLSRSIDRSFPFF
ncbi:UNVERIFIED_CONTAM: Retrovirus-related Pol polyprotein from transposon opus [Sesamum latifolium]|uniref:Retrovirus-related Pol polyprotein from transposon opus n=1 Tax=Sesamum latifolium TaxID=2727402 RepID=A0AAW2X3J8_9LAMI